MRSGVQLNYRGKILFHPIGIIIVPVTRIQPHTWECVVIKGNEQFPVGRKNLILQEIDLWKLPTMEIENITPM